MDNVNGKTIFTASIAKELLKRGNRIIDIKKNRIDNPAEPILFIFDCTDKLINDLTDISNYRKTKRALLYMKHVKNN